MPLFQYRAQDNQGRSVEGAVTAESKLAAQTALKDRGLRIFDLVEKGGAAAIPPARRPDAPAPQAPTIRPPVAAAQAPAVSYHTPQRRTGSSEQILQNQAPPIAKPIPAGPQRINMPAAPPAAIVMTKRGSDAANTFLFAQLASFLRAGVNPAEAFTSLAANPIKPHYRPFLEEAAKSTSEGVRFGAVVERYPYLFPPHIAGMIRAGEEGGYLVEACEQVATQTEESRKFNFWLWVLFWWVMSNVVFLPPLLMMGGALNHMTDSYFGPNASGASSNGFEVMRGGITQSLVWPVGPVTLLTTLACWWGYVWWMKLPQRTLRHRAVLMMPTIGRRARAESLAVFAWTLSMVSRVGIAPRNAWALATNAMTNVWLADQMRQVGDRMTDGTKLSEALTQTGAIPSEYVPMVQTGELVGDVSSSLLTISSASYDESQRQANMGKLRMGCWGMLVIALSFLAGGILIAHFYSHLMTVFSTGE